MVGESNQNVFLIQIDASSFTTFEISEFEISRFDCNAFFYYIVLKCLQAKVYVLTFNQLSCNFFLTAPETSGQIHTETVWRSHGKHAIDYMQSSQSFYGNHAEPVQLPHRDSTGTCNN